jgi:hypothetical protein
MCGIPRGGGNRVGIKRRKVHACVCDYEGVFVCIHMCIRCYEAMVGCLMQGGGQR